MKKLLLIEDNFAEADLVVETIGNKYHLTHVPTVRQAVALLKGISFDAILLDLGLPDSHGIEETVTLIKSLSAGAPVMVMSGMESDNAVFESAEAGAADFLSKTRTIPNDWIPRIENAIQNPVASYQDTILRASLDNLNYVKRLNNCA